ncbi:MAG: hypothetical protein JO041_01930 [Acidobacteria bacterium]|nr:hypothetical protein [Acidobacteriota bacterium]
MALQAADREILRIRQEIAALPKRISDVEAKLNSAHEAVEQAKARIKAGESARRKFEADIQAAQQKISKYRDQSLEVKTNEQYKALLAEIGFAEQSIRQTEDSILETMLESEEQEKRLRAAESELKTQSAFIEREKAEVRSRTEQDERELAEWSARRDGLRAQINPDVVSHYDRVARLRGTGVAEVRDGKCSACNVLLRPQELQEALAGSSVMTCSSCTRILVAVEMPPLPAPRHRPGTEASA